MVYRGLKSRFTALAILAVAPLLMNQGTTDLKSAPGYVALNPRWECAGVVTGASLGHLVGAVACPGAVPADNRLVAVDSDGKATELQFAGGSWATIRSVRIGHPVSVICPGAPQHDRRWGVYLGSPDGQVSELSRIDGEWSVQPIMTFDDPIAAIHATDPGVKGVSQLFVIDSAGHVTNLWIGMDQSWQVRPIPDIAGGVTDLTWDMGRKGLQILVGGPKGELHRFVQDTMGFWSGELWATVPSGVLDMAESTDPSMKDLAIYYAGKDGNFRYLFYDHKTDDVSFIPDAANASHLIGKQNSLRYNEFMGLSYGEYCQFEFNNHTRKWDRVPLYRVGEDVVCVDFGSARPDQQYQFYVTMADGKVYEFVRSPTPPEEPSGE